MSHLSAIDSLEIFRHAYYTQPEGGFVNELISWETVCNLLFEIIGGFSFLLILFKFFSPKIRISPYIACNTKRGQIDYYFKITNDSYFFELVDLKMELYEATPVGNGRDCRMVKVPLSKGGDMPYLDSKRIGINKKESTFAAQFVTANESQTVEIDLKSFLKNNPSCHITVIFACTHTFSSIRRKFLKEYVFSDIIDGEFNSGKLLTVVKN